MSRRLPQGLSARFNTAHCVTDWRPQRWPWATAPARWALLCIGTLVGWSLAACSPALDWREVRLDRLTILLPCKPDRAQRFVRLGATDVSMQMAGCKASDALFAVSHIQLADQSHSADVLAEWQRVALNNMRATDVQASKRIVGSGTGTSSQASHTSRSDRPLRGALELKVVQGRGPDGHTISAQLAWLSDGLDLYHVAVYGETLDAVQTDMLFADIRLK